MPDLAWGESTARREAEVEAEVEAVLYVEDILKAADAGQIFFGESYQKLLAGIVLFHTRPASKLISSNGWLRSPDFLNKKQLTIILSPLQNCSSCCSDKSYGYI